MAGKRECDGNHRYFALEPIIEADGSITIVIVCTSCSDLVTHRLPSPIGKAH